MTAPVNRHATAIVIGATGILITGPSGAGKTTLALALVEAARRAHLFAAFVADDQALLSNAHGRLLAAAPEAIAGLVEIRGSGIAPVSNITAAVMDFALLLVAPEQGERIPEPGEVFEALPGLSVPLARLLWPSPEPFARLCALCPGLGDGRVARPHVVDC